MLQPLLDLLKQLPGGSISGIQLEQGLRLRLGFLE